MHIASGNNNKITLNVVDKMKENELMRLKREKDYQKETDSILSFFEKRKFRM